MSDPHTNLWPGPPRPPWAGFRRPRAGPEPRYDHPDCQDCWAALVVCGACGRPVCPTHHPDLFCCPPPGPGEDDDARPPQDR